MLTKHPEPEIEASVRFSDLFSVAALLYVVRARCASSPASLRSKRGAIETAFVASTDRIAVKNALRRVYWLCDAWNLFGAVADAAWSCDQETTVGRKNLKKLSRCHVGSPLLAVLPLRCCAAHRLARLARHDGPHALRSPGCLARPAGAHAAAGRLTPSSTVVAPPHHLLTRARACAPPRSPGHRRRRGTLQQRCAERAGPRRRKRCAKPDGCDAPPGRAPRRVRPRHSPARREQPRRRGAHRLTPSPRTAGRLTRAHA